MKRHEPDVTSLVFGLLFLGVVALWSLLEFDLMNYEGLDVAAPILLVSVGLAGLMASISKLRRGRD